MMRRRLALAGLLVAVLAGCGGDTLFCTEAGCSSGFTVTTQPLALSEAQLQASTLTVCRNGSCLQGSFAHWSLGHSLLLPDDTSGDRSLATVEVQVAGDPGALRFFILYVTAPASLHDGDLYDVTLTSGDGSTPIALHQTVSYRQFRPNGPHCDPVCTLAGVSL